MVCALIGFGLLALIVEAVMRRGGGYAVWDRWWPALARERRVGSTATEAPFRSGAVVVRDGGVEAGVPVAVSLWLFPAALVALAWSLCVVAALGDVDDVFEGRRHAGNVFASLAFVVTRAVAGGASVLHAARRDLRGFAVSGGLALALDAALAVYPLPCSDRRMDDAFVAAVGLCVHAPFTLGFAWHAWRRRGLVPA